MTWVCLRWSCSGRSGHRFCLKMLVFIIVSACFGHTDAASEDAGTALPGRDHGSAGALVLSLGNGQNRWQLPVAGGREAWIVAISRISRKDSPGEIRLAARLAMGRPENEALAAMVPFSLTGKDAGVVQAGHRVARPVFQGPRLPAAPALAERVFYIQTKGGSSDDLGQYEAIEARLIASGKTVNVYLDQTEVLAGKQEIAARAVQVMDEEIPAAVSPRIGRAADVDGDGKMAVLLTSALSRLADGQMAIDGFVRPSDFDPAGSLPGSHAADVIFLNSRVSDAGYLKSLLAHEYTHAVAATARRALAGDAETGPDEEESWLEEGLAHLSERWVDGSWANLNYRISAYYESPESHRLIVNDVAGLGSGRSHGHRGAAYLFLKWCEETFGSDLPRRLIESPLTGTRNLEVATGVPFEKLYRAWTVNLMAEIAGDGPVEAARSRALLDDWLAGTPRESGMAVGQKPQEIVWRPKATATRFFRITAESLDSGTNAIELELAGAGAGEYQLTAMPLYDSHKGFDVKVLVEKGESGARAMRLLIRNRDLNEALTLQSAAWETDAWKLDHGPAASGMTRAGHGVFDILAIARQFGGYKIGPGKSILTPPLTLPVPVIADSGRIQWKLVAHDESGRPVFGRTARDHDEPPLPQRIASGDDRENRRVR